MRAFIASFVIAIAALVGLASSPAAAEYCGASGNGCDTSMGNTICAGHGAFGAFGDKSGDPATHDFRGGASGDRTAFNNSTLCGNPQGAAGELATP